jgi:uncharacterized membrane protein YbhN (UPF0104 family)
MSEKSKKTLKLLLKLLVTVGALWYVLRRIDPRELETSLSTAHGGWLFLAFVLFNASKIASALRLELFFEAIGLRIERGYNLALYYVGMFYNLFLPGGIGGDGYKIYLLAKRTGAGVKPLFSAILLDRLSGLTGLLFYALALFALSDYARSAGWWSVAASWTAAALLFPLAWWATARFFPAFLGVFRETMAWGMAVQLLQLLCAWAILAAIGVESYRIEYLTLFLISSVVSVLPLTIGGVGVRELTFLYGLQYIGQPPAMGVTFSFLFFIITALSSLFGLFWLNRVAAQPIQETRA